jgi:DNA modification methylase
MTWHKIIVEDSRKMSEINDHFIDLVVTSPPYWSIKNYGVDAQIGYGQTMHEYLKDLYSIWKESFRVLKPGSRLCINIGDQFLRSIVYGRYKIAPLHSEFISQCEKIGFDYMGSIIWQKKTTMNTTGGANVMGSYPYPPNGLIEIDYEFILIFKKPGKRDDIRSRAKELSKMTKEEWKEYFSGHWTFGGERQVDHQAMFPEELPRRLIKMFSFVGDTVLDPFLGSGTTMKVARELKRNSIGYEINPSFLQTIKNKVGVRNMDLLEETSFEIVERSGNINYEPDPTYFPSIQDAEPVIDPEKFRFDGDKLYRVVEIKNPDEIKLDTGLTVKLLGIKIPENKNNIVINYLNQFVKGKEVILKFDTLSTMSQYSIPAYVYLKNKIFINKELIKMGYGDVDEHYFTKRDEFLGLKLESVNNA